MDYGLLGCQGEVVLELDYNTMWSKTAKFAVLLLFLTFILMCCIWILQETKSTCFYIFEPSGIWMEEPEINNSQYASIKCGWVSFCQSWTCWWRWPLQRSSRWHSSRSPWGAQQCWEGRWTRIIHQMVATQHFLANVALFETTISFPWREGTNKTTSVASLVFSQLSKTAKG